MTSPDWVSQWVGASPHKPKCCRFHPQSGCVWEATDRCFSVILMFLCHINISLSLYLSLPLSLKAMKKCPPVRIKTIQVSMTSVLHVCG